VSNCAGSVRVVCLFQPGSRAQARVTRAERTALRVLTRKNGSDGRNAAMELLVIVLALCVLGLLAGRYGYDSRSQLRSREEEAAAFG
jgi:hypothetical protein